MVPFGSTKPRYLQLAWALVLLLVIPLHDVPPPNPQSEYEHAHQTVSAWIFRKESARS